MADSTWVNNSEQVNALVSITANDTPEARDVFVKALNQNSGNLEKVMDEYFSAESFAAFTSKYTYDTQAWAAGKDGDIPTFAVQGPDQHAPASWDDLNGHSLSAAPSRPPSRNKSPLNSVTDWLDTSPGINASGNRLTEEEELQRAIELSMGGSTPQESGITTTLESLQQQSPVFGPATRDDHKVDEWAMIRSTSPPEDSDASDRKREIGIPAFLRCRDASHMHSLGPLIMVLHKIPAARNFFLTLTGGSESYGNDNAWWKGVAIPLPASASSQDLGPVKLQDELKRLMAFLDSSDRTYGTADLLFASNQLTKTFEQWADPIVRFFESIYNFTSSQELSRMWTNVTMEVDGEWTDQEFALLEINVLKEAPAHMRSLYGQWDYTFWSSAQTKPEVEDNPTMACIQRAAKVMTIRVTTTDGIRIDIPEVMYIDRYLKDNAEIARSLRKEMFSMQRATSDYADEVKEVTSVTTKTGQTADLRIVLQRLIMRNEGVIAQIRTRALWEKHEQSQDTDDYFPYLPPELSHLIDKVELNDDDKRDVSTLEAEIQEFKSRLCRVEAKVSDIKARRDKCIEDMTRLNQAFTAPSEDKVLDPTHRYTLRGVVASPTMVWMRRPKEPEPFVQVQDDANSNSWCMLGWDGDKNQVKHEPVTFATVKDSMFTEVDARGNTAPILVYASDEALNEMPAPLSAALQTFVKHDNRFFKQELIEQPNPPEAQRGEKRIGFETPQSPAKRQRSNSGDSMDSNRASPGDMSDGDRARMMQDQMLETFGGDSDIGIDTEMRDMPPISDAQMANEIAAHMPPTPSLSADGSVSPPIRRSTEQLANMTLKDANVEKAPEMEEQSQSPFIVRRPASAQGHLLENPTDSAMTWPIIDETTAIPGGGNPEEFYHPKT